MEELGTDGRRIPAGRGADRPADEEWWFARSALLGEVAPDFADRFPDVGRLERESAPEPPPTDAPVPCPELQARETFTIAQRLTGCLSHVSVAEPVRCMRCHPSRFPSSAVTTDWTTTRYINCR